MKENLPDIMRTRMMRVIAVMMRLVMMRMMVAMVRVVLRRMSLEKMMMIFSDRKFHQQNLNIGQRLEIYD